MSTSFWSNPAVATWKKILVACFVAAVAFGVFALLQPWLK